MSDPATTIANLLRMERATALEEAANHLEDSDELIECYACGAETQFSLKNKATEIRALAPLPATLVVVERSLLERVLNDDLPEMADVAKLKETLR